MVFSLHISHFSESFYLKSKSVLAGHKAGSARSSHRSPVPSLDILVPIHSCRDQNQTHQNKKDSRPPKEAWNGLLPNILVRIHLSLSQFPSLCSLPSVSSVRSDQRSDQTESQWTDRHAVSNWDSDRPSGQRSPSCRSWLISLGLFLCFFTCLSVQESVSLSLIREIPLKGNRWAVSPPT